MLCMTDFEKINTQMCHLKVVVLLLLLVVVVVVVVVVPPEVNNGNRGVMIARGLVWKYLYSNDIVHVCCVCTVCCKSTLLLAK
jgi:hypothetical protein